VKDKIVDILTKYVEVFGFISVNEYLEKRHLLNLKDRYDDETLFRPYKTIITLGIAYPSKEIKWLGKGYGVLSRYSYNIDYHIVFKNILDIIVKEFSELGINSFGSVDTSFVDERYAAYLSGIGYLGKNQFLINKAYGSYLYLATILVDIPIKKDYIEYDSCLDCRLCIDACPSHALDNGFDSNKCISNLTQEKKVFTENEIKNIKTMIYGCDICQKVCPKNDGIDFHIHEEFEPSGIENVNISKLLEYSNKEYKEIYGKNASSWKGVTILKRNALCLIANQGLTEYLDKVIKSINDYKNVSWYKETASKVIKILLKKKEKV